MARKVLIQVRRGLEKDIGTLAVGELGYCEDTSKLYIGTATGNVLLVAAQTVGDMLKSIYDTNNDGKVDMAEVADNVPWSGVTGKPNVTSNEIQLGNYKLIYNETTNSLDIEVVA